MIWIITQEQFDWIYSETGCKDLDYVRKVFALKKINGVYKIVKK